MKLRPPAILVQNANFRRFYTGQAVSMLGDQLTGIALPLTAVLTLHAHAAQMGLLTAAYLVPNLLFALHAGVFVDRRKSRRRVMIVADLGRALLTLVVPVAYLAGHVSWPMLYVVAFAVGTLSTWFMVAYGSVFQSIVTREEYVAANSLINGTRGASGLIGTSIGGALVQLISGPGALVVDAASFLWSAVCLGRVKANEPPPATREKAALGAGARWIRSSPVIRAELIGIATLNLFNYMYAALVILYAVTYLHINSGTLGVVLGIASIGTVVSSSLAGRYARRFGFGPGLIWACGIFTAPLILVPVASGPKWLVISLLFVAELLSGVGVMLLDILAGTINTAMIPPTMRARVSGAFTFVNYGVRPIGAVLGGVLGASLGVRSTLWIATIGSLSGLLFLIPSPLRTMRELPPEPISEATGR